MVKGGMNKVRETVFVGDETFKYVDSSSCRKDRTHSCVLFEGTGVSAGVGNNFHGRATK